MAFERSGEATPPIDWADLRHCCTLIPCFSANESEQFAKRAAQVVERNPKRFQVNHHEQRFYIYKGDQRELVGYTNLGQASVEWMQDPDGRRIVKEDGAGRVLREYSEDECRRAAQDYMRGRGG